MNSPEDKPNILFILTDQHRLSALGAYGDTPCKTPNLDRLAAQGSRFETAYTTCPVCSPARASIMTGQFPHAHGVTSNVHNLGCSVHELTDRPELLSRRLQSAGYQCGYTGKWHLGENLSSAFGSKTFPSLPRDVGFEGQNFPGHGGGGFNYPEYQEYLRKNGWKHHVTHSSNPKGYGCLCGPVESTVPYFLTDHTINLLKRFANNQQPFFIWHNFWGPHEPYFATEEYLALYRDIPIPPWPNYQWESFDIHAPYHVKRHPQSATLKWPHWEELIRHYYAFTSMIDAQIGRMLDHLEASGQADDTIIIFSADHGETLGSHGGLTDKGWHHFEEIQRIPLIMHIPEKYQRQGFDPKGVFSQWASLADFYPTILDYAGMDVKALDGLHGSSLRPILEGRECDWRTQAVVEFNGLGATATTMLSIREGDLKYGWNSSNKDELYDLKHDPYEMKNLIDTAAYKAPLNHMRQALLAWMEKHKYDPRTCRLLQATRLAS